MNRRQFIAGILVTGFPLSRPGVRCTAAKPVGDMPTTMTINQARRFEQLPELPLTFTNADMVPLRIRGFVCCGHVDMPNVAYLTSK